MFRGGSGDVVKARERDAIGGSGCWARQRMLGEGGGCGLGPGRIESQVLAGARGRLKGERPAVRSGERVSRITATNRACAAT